MKRFQSQYSGIVQWKEKEKQKALEKLAKEVSQLNRLNQELAFTYNEKKKILNHLEQKFSIQTISYLGQLNAKRLVSEKKRSEVLKALVPVRENFLRTRKELLIFEILVEEEKKKHVEQENRRKKKQESEFNLNSWAFEQSKQQLIIK